jgi:hypothetical protein
MRRLREVPATFQQDALKSNFFCSSQKTGWRWSLPLISNLLVLDKKNATVATGRITTCVSLSSIMSRTIAPNFGKQSTPRLRRFSGVLTALLGIFLLTVGPAQADPIQMNRVVQTLRTVQGTTDIQLTLITQDPVNGGPKTPAPTSGPGIGSSDPKLDALLSGFPIVSADLDLGVDDVAEDGEVDGTICDCGEILIAGGFPKWPLLFLAAVPLAFIPDCDDCRQDEPTPTPTPTPSISPTPTPTPEPASLLLFGSGLVAFGAGLRHRYKKAKLADQIRETEEEQS